MSTYISDFYALKSCFYTSKDTYLAAVRNTYVVVVFASAANACILKTITSISDRGRDEPRIGEKGIFNETEPFINQRTPDLWKWNSLTRYSNYAAKYSNDNLLVFNGIISISVFFRSVWMFFNNFFNAIFPGVFLVSYSV